MTYRSILLRKNQLRLIKRNNFTYTTIAMQIKWTTLHQVKLSVMALAIILFLTSWLSQYSKLIEYLGLNGDISVPRGLVMGFNIFEDDRDKLREFLHKHFNLPLKTYPGKQTTLSVSYFSHIINLYLIKIVCN